MSIIKDFKELHIGLRTSVLTILCQIPFFFVSIFLFKYDLIEKVSAYPLTDMDFWFLITLCFCFSLTWFFMNVALTFILVAAIDKISNSNTSPSDTYVASMIISIFFLSAIIVIAYRWDFSFNTFLVVSYSYIVFRIIEGLVSNAIIPQQEQSESSIDKKTDKKTDR